MPIAPLDVIWINDELISPPGPKMVVCIDVDLGYYFRINTKKWQYPILLEKSKHPFLKHDSYLECGDPLILDDYLIESSLQKKPIIGRISEELIQDIWNIVKAARTISPADKDTVRKSLGIRD